MNGELHEHISRLLFDHECVVVPGFGAFLTRYYSAEINPATNMLRPPSRRVYFNKSIKENDGLLAKTISFSEKCSYDLAMDFVKSSVSDWKQQLQSGRKLRLEGIGRLYIDESNNLQFNPSLENNYQRSSYGLAIFRTPSIHREIAIKKGIQKTIEKHITPDKKPATKTSARKPIPWAAILGPVIFAGLLGAAYFTYQNRPFDQVSGLDLFQFSRSIPTEVVSDEAEEAVMGEKVEEAKPETAIEPEVSTPESVKPEAREDIPVAQLYPYHIVVGSFKDLNNAEAYIAQLQSKGYDSYMANGKPGFHRVAIGNFATKDQAKAALQGVRQNLQSGAWIYSN